MIGNQPEPTSVAKFSSGGASRGSAEKWSVYHSSWVLVAGLHYPSLRGVWPPSSSFTSSPLVTSSIRSWQNSAREGSMSSRSSMHGVEWGGLQRWGMVIMCLRQGIQGRPSVLLQNISILVEWLLRGSKWCEHREGNWLEPFVLQMPPQPQPQLLASDSTSAERASYLTHQGLFDSQPLQVAV